MKNNLLVFRLSVVNMANDGFLYEWSEFEIFKKDNYFIISSTTFGEIYFNFLSRFLKLNSYRTILYH